jgi:glycosyltransferase involved in cell wall biosynthesis
VLEDKGIQAIYTDATITAHIKYGLVKYPEKLIKSVNRQFIKYAPRIDVFFTMNEWTKESLINDFNIEPNKVHNVSFGINVEPYFGVKNYSNMLLLTVIRKGAEKLKGTYLLLDAFKLAKKKLPNIKLAVVGSTLENIDGVTYYEGYPREKTKELFKEASVYIMPALMEVNGITYLEALASKSPTLGLNRCAYPEFCGYGKYGFIAKEATSESIEEQILQAFSNVDRLKNMGELGQKFVLAKFTWDRTADNIINILNSIR